MGVLLILVLHLDVSRLFRFLPFAVACWSVSHGAAELSVFKLACNSLCFITLLFFKMSKRIKAETSLIQSET